ncbi:MAG: histidinol-phosphatase, partial [Desulfobacterales bacterium]|nr:histidinol-phosphatase [Desulfobacterales bacterium]
MEEISGGTRSITAVSSSTAALLGVAPAEGKHLNEPVAISNWSQFVREFVEKNSPSTDLARAVFGFFNNGGSRCYVLNVGKGNPIAGDERRREGISALETVDEARIIAAPGYTDISSYETLISHCEKMKNRFAILDAPFQVDNLEQLEFLPKVFRVLYNIRKNTNYELVIVSNQDGLGTPAYPQARFDLIQKKMLQYFANEGVVFDNILIDKSFPEEKLPTRKPETGLLSQYMNGDYDLSQSFVIGDRISDIKLAKNLGAKGILIGDDQLKDEIIANGLQRSLSPCSTFLSGLSAPNVLASSAMFENYYG